jgi:hypothetical protein
VLDAQVPARVTEAEGFVTTAVVGHHAGDGDAEAFIVSHGRLEEGNCTIGLLVGLDLGEREAGVIVDADVDELPADAATVALAGPITGDPMTNFVETTQLSNVDVDDLAGMLAFIATHRLGRLQHWLRKIGFIAWAGKWRLKDWMPSVDRFGWLQADGPYEVG